MTPATPDLGYAVTLPPQDAIAYLESKGYAIGFSWRDVWQEAHARAFTAAGVMKVDVLADLKDGLVKSLQTGGTRQDFIKQVTPLLQAKGWWGKDAQVDPTTGEVLGKGLTPRRLATIFDTNMQSAYMAGRYKSFMSNVGDRPYWMYVAIMDKRTRPAHAALNGRTFRYDDPIWNSIYPPNGFRCFPPGTLVRADAAIGLKTWYAGEMVELETRFGKALTLTANHPVLTGRGWLPAHAIQEGDQVLSDKGIVDAGVIGVVDHQQAPARAEDLFEALKTQGFRIVPMAAHDFHGDALLRKPEIHIAGADRLLMDEIEIAAQQFIGQRYFRRTDASASRDADLADRSTQAGSILVDAMLAQDAADVAEARIQALGDGPLRCRSGAVKREHPAFDIGVEEVGGSPCGAELTANGGRVGLDHLPLERFRLALVAQGYAVQAQDTPECGTTEAQLIGELLEANPGLIALDEVVRVIQFDWAGHVFDFQTATGLMFAGGIVVHNCRCSVRALDGEDLKSRGIDLSSSTGRLSEIEIATSRKPDAPTATVTRFEYAPGKYFHPDAGWSYNPGKAGLAHLNSLVEQKLITIDAPLGAALAENLRPVLRTEMSRAFEAFVKETLSAPMTRGRTITVGALDPLWVKVATERGAPPATAEILVRDVDVWHTFRDSKTHKLDLSWYASLPEHLAAPQAVILDTTRPDAPAFLLLYDVSGDAKKLVLRLNYRIKKVGEGNIIETGKRVDPSGIRAMLGKGYQIVDGSL